MHTAPLPAGEVAAVCVYHYSIGPPARVRHGGGSVFPCFEEKHPLGVVDLHFHRVVAGLRGVLRLRKSSPGGRVDPPLNRPVDVPADGPLPRQHVHTVELRRDDECVGGFPLQRGRCLRQTSGQ